MSMRSIFYSSEGKTLADLEYYALVDAVKGGSGVLWLDFEDPQEEQVEGLLAQIFSFHPLAIDNALRESKIPKLDDWVNYLYLVFHLPEHQDAPFSLKIRELDIFIGKNYLVTYHRQSLTVLNEMWEAVQRDPRYLQHGSIYLLYRLVDDIVASFMPLADAMHLEIDRLEEQLFQAPKSGKLERILELKRLLADLLRTFGHIREVIMALAREEHHLIDSRARYYFRNTYDHLMWIEDLLERSADQISQLLDTYLLLVNNKMSEAMKTLAIIATIFYPLSFLTSFFGMNFFFPAVPIQAWVTPAVFALVLVFIAIFPYGLYRWLFRKGWI